MQKEIDFGSENKKMYQNNKGLDFVITLSSHNHLISYNFLINVVNHYLSYIKIQ